MNSPDNRGTVHELIQQRERLRGWIAKLDEVRGDAPDRVAQRVRGDYQARLEGVVQELSTHREELERDLGARREALEGAEERRAAVQDALEEARLRHMIGELDEADWEKQRPGLEGGVSAAEEALETTRAEVEDLERLVAEIRSADAEPEEEPAAPEPEPQTEPETEPEPDAAAEPVAEGEEEPADELPRVSDEEADRFADAFVDDAFPEEAAPPAAAPSAPAAPTADPFGDEFPGSGAADDEDLPWLESLERRTAEWESGSTSAESGLEFLDSLGIDKPGASDAQIAEDDLAFLEELDRAIAGNAPPPPVPPAQPVKATDLPTQPSGPAPAGRLICKECGAPNEPHAWYCEVCGSEL